MAALRTPANKAARSPESEDSLIVSDDRYGLFRFVLILPHLCVCISVFFLLFQ